MTTITFIHPDGSRKQVEGTDGTSLMQAATLHGIDAIVAECGGNCMCATCHVHIDDAQLGLLPPMSEDEDALLDGTAAARTHNSRLSCQVMLRPDLDGLLVTLPDRQV